MDQNRRWGNALPYLLVLLLLLLFLPRASVQAGIPVEFAGKRNLQTYPFQSGFSINTTDWTERSAPIIADIDGDGENELLAGNWRGRIYAWTAAGTLKPGFPISASGPIVGHLALADLDGNGDLEIVAGVGDYDNGDNGHVYVWRPNGNVFPGWPRTVARYGNDRQCKIATVALGDLDGDGDLEIVAGTNNNNFGPDFAPYVPNLYAWHHDGTTVAGQWPVEDSDDAAILGNLAVGDLDGDGQNDVIVARDYHRVFAYDGQGNDLAGWPRYTFVPEDGIWNVDPRIAHRFSAPTLADLSGDGALEYIVAGYRRPAGSTTIYNNDLLVLRSNGTRLSGWEQPAGGNGALSNSYLMQQASVVADLDGDGQLGTIVPTLDGWIRAYRVDQTLLWQFNYAQGKLIYASEPVIGDIDGDDHYEIVFGVYDPKFGDTQPVGVWILEHDGVPKASIPLPVAESGVLAAPTLGDLDGDGDLEIAAVTPRGWVYVWDVPAPYTPELMPWPMARHDLRRTARYIELKPSLERSTKTVRPAAAEQGQVFFFTVEIVRTGVALTSTVRLTDIIPSGLTYVPGSLVATSGAPDAAQAPTLRWTGLLSDVTRVTLTYATQVTTPSTVARTNAATIDNGRGTILVHRATVILNGYKMYLPLISRNF